MPPIVTQLASKLSSALGLTGCFLLVFMALEWLGGRHPREFSWRSFRTDLAYRASSIFLMVTVCAPLMLVLNPFFRSWSLQLLRGAPVWLSLPTSLLFHDFFSYWVHRARHSRFLWRFHRIHHGAESLNFLTGFRAHPIDFLFIFASSLVPGLVLGTSVGVALPVFIVRFVDGMHHAHLHWDFGPFRKLFVSPVFHAAHHSTQARFYDRNFGDTFSCWDFLFGTAEDCRQRPVQTGVTGWIVRESFWAQLLSPFRREAVPAEDAEERKAA